MEDTKQEIQARFNEISELLSAGKNEEAFAYYTEECKVMAQGYESASGKEGLKELSKAMADLQSKVGKTESSVEEIFGNDEVITCRGKGTTYGKDGSVLLKTRSISVWKKVDGKWLVHNYIWNT